MKLTGREIFFSQEVREVTSYPGYREHSHFQAGYGYGDIYGEIYCTDDGRGYGMGFLEGHGSFYYPHQLIQYWE